MHSKKEGRGIQFVNEASLLTLTNLIFKLCKALIMTLSCIFKEHDTMPRRMSFLAVEEGK